jgi:cysteinyl-tRNA synthetase
VEGDAMRRLSILVSWTRTLCFSAVTAMGVYLPFDVFAVTLTTSDGPIVVNSWGYRLQGSSAEGGELLPNPLAAATHHLLVMDFARYGDEGSKFTTQEVSDIKNSAPSRGGNGARKVVAAYVSIGEASEFRSYWDPAWTVGGNASDPLAPGAPSWLGPVNPDWPESRKVRYWEPGWQDIIYGSVTAWLDQVVAQGFDAAYLDIVDAYYFWAVELDAGDRLPGDPAAGDEKDAAQRMVDFIAGMTNHARQTNADFFVIPQNGGFIIDALEDQDPTRKASFLEAIGATGVEDTYFIGGSDENNPFSPDTDKIDILKQDFLGNGRPVFAVDYVNDAGKVQQFYDESVDDGFIPYAAPDRDLDVLGVPEPDALLQTVAVFAALGLVARRRRAEPWTASR